MTNYILYYDIGDRRYFFDHEFWKAQYKGFRSPIDIVLDDDMIGLLAGLQAAGLYTFKRKIG